MKFTFSKVFLALTFATTGLATSPAAIAQTRLMTVTTGGVTGVYYAAAGAICRLVNRDRARNSIRCTVEASAGSLANIDSLNRNAASFGVVQSDVHYAAVKGVGAYEKAGAQPELRSVFSMYPELLTVLTSADSNAKVAGELKGQRVSIGMPGSGSRALVEDWFKVTGWQPADSAQVQERSADAQGIALCEKKIDAMAYVVGHPASNVARTLKDCGARLLPLDPANIDKYLAQSPYAVRSEIPAGTYPGQTAAVPTIAVMATLMASSSVSDDMVYATVKAVFDNFDELKKLYPTFSFLDPKVMVTVGLTAPLHPGAVKYYVEKGWL
jgi:TRAP transporter TAXI family solute receptor